MIVRARQEARWERVILGRPGLDRTFRFLAFLYGVLTFIAASAFPVMMYHPPPAGYGVNDPEVFAIDTVRGDSISAIYHTHPTAKLTVLYSHGNATDIGYLNEHLKSLRDLGCNVMAYEYLGYGRNVGDPSEKATYQDIRAAYAYLTEEKAISPAKIVLYGRSMGSGPTIDLASEVDAAGVIIESGFRSAYTVMTGIPLFPFDKYRNQTKMSEISAPVLVIHGDQDEVVPYSHGVALFKAAKGPKDLLTVSAGGHNDLNLIPDNGIAQAVSNFLLRLTNL